MQDGRGILIVDAGGGTIDVSAYKKTSPISKSYEEIAPPQCLNILYILLFIFLISYLKVLSRDQYSSREMPQSFLRVRPRSIFGLRISTDKNT